MRASAHLAFLVMERPPLLSELIENGITSQSNLDNATGYALIDAILGDPEFRIIGESD
jgi:hypothetical protein